MSRDALRQSVLVVAALRFYRYVWCYLVAHPPAERTEEQQR